MIDPASPAPGIQAFVDRLIETSTAVGAKADRQLGSRPACMACIVNTGTEAAMTGIAVMTTSLIETTKTQGPMAADELFIYGCVLIESNGENSWRAAFASGDERLAAHCRRCADLNFETGQAQYMVGMFSPLQALTALLAIEGPDKRYTALQLKAVGRGCEADLERNVREILGR
ncbi:hypothetical protein SEA_BIGGITYBASS_61 [Gordonia phage BiggityBass]|nr:hypothetical protein SEA_BIGGITYBASS_61 [Gordonia phage BiggityBass]